MYILNCLGMFGGYILFFFFFWPRCVSCGILVPRPGIEPLPLALEAWSLNRWTTREVPGGFILLKNSY